VGQGSPQVVEVTVTGRGISEDEALKDALRRALEQGASVEISSHSRVENFELIRDAIYSRADGLIKDYRILDKGDEVGGVKFVKIIAKVSKSAIASEWGEVQNMLDQIGRPGVAVYIVESIDGQVQDSSILESKIEERLVKAGFDVYARDQLEAIASKESTDSELENNVAKLRAIAKRFSTQIFITGTAQANAAGVKELLGQPTAMYNGDAAVKMYYTDTGKLLASESIPNWRGGARGFFTKSPQAGKKALENAGRDLVDKIYNTVMRQWATQISAGGEIRLEIQGMTMGDAIRLKKKLAAIPKVERVNGPSLDKGIATFRILAKMNAETMAGYLVEGEFGQMMNVIDLKLNRIQAEMK